MAADFPIDKRSKSKRRVEPPSLIQFYIDYHEVIGLKRFLENGLHFFRSRNRVALCAKQLGQPGKVGHEELGADHATAVIFQLIALHAAVGVVAEYQDEQRDIVIARGSELLLFHHEGAVAGDTDNAGVGAAELDAESRRQRRADGAKLTGMNDWRRGVDIAQRVPGHPRRG